MNIHISEFVQENLTHNFSLTLRFVNNPKNKQANKQTKKQNHKNKKQKNKANLSIIKVHIPLSQ